MKNRNSHRPNCRPVKTVHGTSVSRLANSNGGLAALLVTASFLLPAQGAEPRANRITQVTQTFRDLAVEPQHVVEDLGDIRPLADQSILRRIRFTSSLYGEFVSNAQSIGSHDSPDFLLIPTVSASVEQPIGHGLSLDFTARSEAFIYARYDELSFWGFSGSIFGRYQPTKEWPTIYAGIEPYWYSSIRDGNRVSQITTGSQISNAVAVSVGIEKDWAFNRDQTVLFVGYNFSDYFSSPSSDNRTSHRATVAVTHQIRPSLFGQLFYSYQYSDYLDIDRRDSRNFAGVNFIYQFDENWFARASAYFVDNDSSQSISSYQTLGVGLAVGYNF